MTRKRFRLPVPALAAATLAASLLLPVVPVRAAETLNVHFLDPGSGEHLALRALLLREIAQKPTPEALVRLGWVRFLYFADAPKAAKAFEKALALNPAADGALLGLALAHYARGRPFDAARCVRAFIRQHPDSPETEAILLHGGSLFPFRPGLLYSETRDLIWDLLKKGSANPFTTAELRRQAAYYYRVEERFDEAHELWTRNGHVPAWYVIGRFGPEGASWFDAPLGPEEKIDIHATYRSGTETLSWKPVSFIRTDPGTPVGMAAAMLGDGAIAYYLAYIKALKKTAVAFRMQASGSVRLWLNGTAVGVFDRYRRVLPSKTAAAATLAEGWNVLLIKTASAGRRSYGSGSLLGRNYGVRVTRPDGSPAPGLVFSADFEAGKVPATPCRGFEAEGGPVAHGALSHFRQASKSPKRTIVDLLLLGLLCRGEGLDEEAFEAFETLHEAHRGWSMSGAFLADAFRRYRAYPWDLKRRKRQALLEKTVAMDPNLLPARLALIDMKADKNAESALAPLRRLVKEHPEYYDAQVRLAGLYSSLGWTADRLSTLGAISKRWSGDSRVEMLWEQYYRGQGNDPRALDLARKRLSREGVPFQDSLSYYWGRMGRLDLVEPVLKKRALRSPDNVWCRRQLLDIYKKTARYREALAILDERERINPEEKSILSERAALLVLAGDLAGARKVFAQMLALGAKYKTYDSAIRRSLHFAGTHCHEDRNKPYRVDIEKIAKQGAAAMAKYKDVSTVVLFEQHLIRFYGVDLCGADVEVEQVVLILNKAGGEKYGRLGSRGRMIAARVFTPDGRVLEPDPVQDGWSTALPKLDRGSVIHLRYLRSRRPPTPGEGLRVLDRSTSIRRIDEPVVRFRYVVVLPEKALYSFRVRNLDDEPEVRRGNGETALIWDLKDVKDVERESFLPRRWEILPDLRFFSGAPLADRLDRNLRSSVMDEKVSGPVRKKAEELVKGIETQGEKVRTLYAFCVREIKQGWNSDPLRTLLKKEGSASEIFEAMTRAVGIDICQVRYARRNPRGVDWDFLRSPSLSRGVYLLRLDTGKTLWVAPGAYVPFGCLPDEAYGAAAVILSRKGCRLAEIPSRPVEERTSGIEAQLTVSADGSAEVKGSLIFPGAEAAGLRVAIEKYLSPSRLRTFISMLLNQIFRGIAVADFTLSEFALDDPVARGSYSGKVALFATKTEDGLIIKPVPKPLTLSRLFVRETRRCFPLRLGAGGSSRGMQMNVGRSIDRFRYVLPKGSSIVTPRSIIVIGEFGEYGLTYVVEGNVLTVERRIRMYPKDVPTDRFAAFKRFCKSVDQWEQATVRVRLPK